MGSRPGDSKGAGTGLAQDNVRDFAEFAANLVGKRLVCIRMRLLAFVPLTEESFDSGCGSSNQPRGAAIEAALLPLAGFRPGRRDVATEVAFGAGAEAAIDQSKGMAHARQP